MKDKERPERELRVFRDGVRGLARNLKEGSGVREGPKEGNDILD